VVGRGLGWGWCEGSWAKGGGDKGNCVLVYAVWIGGGGGVGFGVAGRGLESRIGRL
jgi:hypothetical protein